MNEIRKPVLDVLRKQQPTRIPFWLMRQAGRYLPEYLELRAEAGSFLNLVYNPEKAAEVTVQPLRRFGMDAAILFSDILVIPDALGQKVRFETGEGPRLEPLKSEEDFKILDLKKIETACAPVFETVSRVRLKMKDEGFLETAMIGFCGSPWTVICYMLEGRGSKNFFAAKEWMKERPASFQTLVDIVVEASCVYLSGQIKAGAEVIQLFDSWSGLLDQDDFQKWVVEPTKKIRTYLKNNHPDVPVIGFPRGAGVLSLTYAQDTGVDCLALDQSIDPIWAVEKIQSTIPIQGNLDPEMLLAGGEPLERGLADLRKTFSNGGWIFNLGHGVIKETPVENVMFLKNTIRSW